MQDMPRNRLTTARKVLAALLLFAAGGCRTGSDVAKSPQPRAWPDEVREAAGFEDYFQSVREGATAPGIIRGSGGCGCYEPAP